MSSMLESFQKKSFFPAIPLKESLPISQANNLPNDQTLRKRISSALSVKIQPISSPASSWAFRRSKSMSSMGDYAGSSLTTIRKCWDTTWAWILSRKPTFAKDLEMNEEESAMLGCHNKGSWKHVFYKVKAEFSRMVGSYNHVGAPKGFRYDSYSYAKNFDDGKGCES